MPINSLAVWMTTTTCINTSMTPTATKRTTNARDIEYTAFSKTKKLMTQTANSTQTNEITYDANNNRIIQKAYYDTSTSTNPSKVTYHINKGYELIQTTDEHSNQITIHRHHLYADGKRSLLLMIKQSLTAKKP
ncbi:hypothetical protein [Isorropodon fossajaponicum symbiont]|uniref:hypothetical protein n=1 Tax=Isorropodon fossajaponicum symbiont TaxID=883811 RepID=UPI001CEDA112|nr:hypothetical protein [Isorropodon fossajaponicum symbiont]